MKDCIEIWQKATIRDALPEEYKEKTKQEQGTKGREAQLEQSGSGQSTEFAPFDENGNIQRDPNLANSDSLAQ